jgi:anti-sigma factor RsiW
MTHQNEIHCHKILGRLNAYIDGELDPSLCSLLEDHLKTCSDCQTVYKTLKKTIELCQMEGEEIHLPLDARQRLLSSLGLEDDDLPNG